ncbi:MAG: transposase [Desulfobacterales bacterium]|nr:transposase [Desulfobacterales bacterium]
MLILHDLLKKLKNEFSNSRQGKEWGTWFIYTLLAIIIPFTSSKTSNLLRCLKTVFGFADIRKKRFYTFMASPKIPWQRLWLCLWKLIPDPLTDGRLFLALDDCINPKTGKKIFGCDTFFDHAAKQNQSKYPWAQNIVVLGLLKKVKGRWACLPLIHRFYHLKKNIEHRKPEIKFETKLEQAVHMIIEIADAFPRERILVATDSWFGNNSLYRPLRQKLGQKFHLLSRLRSNNTIFDMPDRHVQKGPGRPRKYGSKLGDATSLAVKYRLIAKEYDVNLYSRTRTVLAFDRIVMLKTLKTEVKVVWVYRKTRWVALFSTDLTLSVQEMIEYYGARWKIEAAFKELKQDIGSAETQTRHPNAVLNHLHFCMMASSLTWIYASRLEKTPIRRHAVSGRNHFAFSDVRRLIAEAALADNFDSLFPVPRKSVINSLAAVLLRMAA